MERIKELDLEACNLLAELFKEENSCFVEGKTIEEIAGIFESMGSPKMTEGVLMRSYFSVTAQMYDLKNPLSNILYEKDSKNVSLKYGKINNEIGFILIGPKKNEK